MMISKTNPLFNYKLMTNKLQLNQTLTAGVILHIPSLIQSLTAVAVTSNIHATNNRHNVVTLPLCSLINEGQSINLKVSFSGLNVTKETQDKKEIGTTLILRVKII